MKKQLLMFGTLITMAAPIAAVVSCDVDDDRWDDIDDGQGELSDGGATLTLSAFVGPEDLEDDDDTAFYNAIGVIIDSVNDKTAITKVVLDGRYHDRALNKTINFGTTAIPELNLAEYIEKQVPPTNTSKAGWAFKAMASQVV